MTPLFPQHLSSHLPVYVLGLSVTLQALLSTMLLSSFMGKNPRLPVSVSLTDSFAHSLPYSLKMIRPRFCPKFASFQQSELLFIPFMSHLTPRHLTELTSVSDLGVQSTSQLPESDSQPPHGVISMGSRPWVSQVSPLASPFFSDSLLLPPPSIT